MFDIEQSPRPLIPAPQKWRTRLPLRPLPDAIAGFRGGRELRIRKKPKLLVFARNEPQRLKMKSTLGPSPQGTGLLWC